MGHIEYSVYHATGRSTQKIGYDRMAITSGEMGIRPPWSAPGPQPVVRPNLVRGAAFVHWMAYYRGLLSVWQKTEDDDRPLPEVEVNRMNRTPLARMLQTAKPPAPYFVIARNRGLFFL